MSAKYKYARTALAAATPAGPPAGNPNSNCSFDELPGGAFVREAQLVRSPKRPFMLAALPFSAPTLWRMVKANTFPEPYKLSKGVTAWKVSDVRAWIDAQSKIGGAV